MTRACPIRNGVVIEVLQRACALGSRALKYVEAKDPSLDGQAVAGVTAVDRETGQSHRYQASIVVNATDLGAVSLPGASIAIRGVFSLRPSRGMSVRARGQARAALFVRFAAR